MTFGVALLNGSSDGMRSSQRCSESFSCEEKYSRTSRLTFPLAAGDVFSLDASLDLGEDALALVSSAAFPFDFSAAAALATGSGLGGASPTALSGRSSLYCNFLSRRKACLQPSNLCL